MKAKPYNGHKSWNYWNVSLWINNDEGLYNFCRDTVRHFKGHRAIAIQAIKDNLPEKTPDGARYTKAAIRAAIKEL